MNKRVSASAAGLFLVAIIFAADNSPAQASPTQKKDLVKGILGTEIAAIQAPFDQPLPKAPAPPKPPGYIVANGETLSKIAEAHATTWQRLYAKNLTVKNPDIINVGDHLVIPAADEVLSERPLPAALPPAPVQVTRPASPAKVKPKAAATSSQAVPRGSAGGNSYSYGYCTYYAKQRRPDLPNNLGNANTWVSRAAAQGIPTGRIARAGAIGQQGMHVVYVEAVNGDGTIRVSEMNYAGFGVVSSRTAAAGSFQYIY